jgi:ABC-type sugar transport system ATPase subunit
MRGWVLVTSAVSMRCGCLNGVGETSSVTVLEETTRQPDVGREILALRGVSKTFPGTRALIDVDLDVRSGEVHALVGHNGSGKSTLVKVLAGYHHPDPGLSVTLDGEAAELTDLGHGEHGGRARLSFVHQDLGLVLELSTIDNLALHGGFSRTRYGRVRWRQQAEQARTLMAPFGIDFDISEPLSRATPVERTIVAIAGALQAWDSSGGVLVLDEPTAVLPPHEVGQLFSIVKELRAGGAGILYVSHRLDEIFELADRVTVLRNGRKIATRPVAELSKQQLVELMLGEEADAEYRAPIVARPKAAPLLEVQNLCGRFLRGVSFTLHEGEVLGVAGLPVDGRDELPRLLTDAAATATNGSVRLPQHAERWVDITRWRGDGVALLPPDRAREGVIGAMSVGENLSLSTIGRFQTAGRLDHRREARFVESWIDQLRVKTASAASPIATLSGGNQQKVLLGRALAIEPNVLVMCEPTAGVDIGARHAIYELIAGQVQRGLGVLVASSDVGDLQALCTRVLVLREGIVVRELEGETLNEYELIHAMEGLESDG